MQTQTKKPTREQLLEAQLDAMERDRAQRMHEVRAALKVADRDAVFATTSQVAKNAKKLRDKVQALRQERDRRVREAAAAYELAVRAAQGEKKRRENEAERDFEASRDDLEEALSTLNAPLRAEYQRKRVELLEEAQDEVNRIDLEFVGLAKPLIDEPKAINDAKVQAQDAAAAAPTANTQDAA